VLVLIKGLGMGGAEQLIVESAKTWDRDRFDYHVAYVLPWKDQLVDPLRSLRVPVTCIGGRKGKMNAVTWARLRRLVSDFDPAIIHAHLPATGILARLGTSRPIVYTEHNLADSYRFPTGLLNRVSYRRNRAVGAVSEAVATTLAGFPGPDPVVIPNGVSVDVPEGEPARIRAELGIDADRPLVVHVGNIRPLKGHENLTQATVDLVRRISDVLVVSVGGEKNDGDLDRVRARAEELGVSESIRFMGRRDDARSFIAAADVFVNPSDVEGLPLVVLEALAMARPVVATAVGGVPTVIIDGVTGVLVPPGSPGELAAAISDMIERDDRADLAAAGARLVEERFGAPAMVRAYEEMYERIARG
jgi:glycosyltransferase involved in cell wall biosynthesis